MSGPALPSSEAEMFSCPPYAARITGGTCLKRQDYAASGEKKAWTGRGPKPHIDVAKCVGCKLGEQVRASIAKGPLPPVPQLPPKVTPKALAPTPAMQRPAMQKPASLPDEGGVIHADAPPEQHAVETKEPPHALAEAVRAIVASRAPLLEQLTAERSELLERLDAVDELIVQLGGEPAEQLLERAVAEAAPRRKRGRPPGRFGTTLRIEDLRRLLASHPEGLTLYEISAELGVTARSLRRYFESGVVGVERKLIGGPHPALFRLREE